MEHPERWQAMENDEASGTMKRPERWKRSELWMKARCEAETKDSSRADGLKPNRWTQAEPMNSSREERTECLGCAERMKREARCDAGCKPR